MNVPMYSCVDCNRKFILDDMFIGQDIDDKRCMQCMENLKPNAEHKTEADRFNACYNFMNIMGWRVQEIKFMDGSVSRYGYDWLD